MLCNFTESFLTEFLGVHYVKKKSPRLMILRLSSLFLLWETIFSPFFGLWEISITKCAFPVKIRHEHNTSLWALLMDQSFVYL